MIVDRQAPDFGGTVYFERKCVKDWRMYKTCYLKYR